MSVTFVSGKPGAGKSFRCVQLLIAALKDTNRVIVTNLPLNLPNLYAYLIQQHGQHFDAPARVRVLSESETMTFWLFYGIDAKLDINAKTTHRSEDGKVWKVPDFSPRSGVRVLYIIDEAHLYFSARGYRENSDEGFWYLSQHRHFGDEVIFATQYVENVDKRFRTVAGSFIYMRNRTQSNLPILGGLIRSIPGFTQLTYPEPYRHGLQSEGTFFLRCDFEGIGKCYDTSGGVGVAGLGPEAKPKLRGFPWWAGFVPLLLIAYALYRVPDMLSGLASRHSAVSIQPLAAVPSVEPPVVPVNSPSVVVNAIASPPERIIDYTRHLLTHAHITGFAMVPGAGVLSCWLSDGRVLSEKDPDVVSVGYDVTGKPSRLYTYQGYYEKQRSNPTGGLREP